MKKLLLALSCFVATLAFASTKSFTVDDDTDFWNPERGFYHYSSINLDGRGSSRGALGQGSFQDCQNDNMSLKFRYYIMEHYNNGSAIAQADLNRISSDCAAARAAGCKLIIRFSYSNSGYNNDNDWHITEPTKAQMQAHMAQLKPILAANADVIAVVQAGFVGIWGEWFFTSTFGKDWSNPNAVNDRNDIINSLLDMAPADRFVQLRTVHYITEYVGNGNRSYTGLTDQTAFSGSAQSRLGHHNDAFGASEDNWGTYYDKGNEYNYLKNMGLYAPLGGESAGGDYNWYKGSQAMSDMENLHYDYMHVDYHEDCVGAWKREYPQGSSKSYFDIMKRRLGYRFQLTSATISNEVAPGGTFNVKLSMKNSGFSNLYNKRIAYIVLKSSTKTYKLPLSSDPRLWKCGQTTSINENLTLPTNIPTGTYSIYLNLPDMYASIANNKAYAIQLANKNMGWTNDGLNDLGMTITVRNGAADSGDEEGEQGGQSEQEEENDGTHATSIDFMALAAQYDAYQTKSTNGIQTELAAHNYTIASSSDGEVYWDNQAGADGGLGIDNPNGSQHPLSFSVPANYKVTITVGTLNGDGSSNTATLTMNGGTPITINQNTTTEYTTTEETQFVLTFLPDTKGWSWNRVQSITIQPLPGSSTDIINSDLVPGIQKFIHRGHLYIRHQGRIYNVLAQPL